LSTSSVETLTQSTIGGLKVQTVGEKKPFFNCLFYGNPGVGKTMLAGSASAVPEMSPVLFIDIEGGTLSLRTRYPNVDVVRVQTWKDMQKVYDDLYKGQHGYKTVVLDSLTEIQKFSMYNIMWELLEKEPSRDPDIPSIREWGKNIEQIRRLTRAFRDLDVNCIFTALEMEVRDPKSGVTAVKPSLSGKLSNEVAGFIDLVLYMYIKIIDNKVERFLLTGATDKHTAKWRDAPEDLPQAYQDPTMAKLYDLWIKE